MQTIQEKRFRVQNLDCAACATKIERELLKTEGVEVATLDFANLTLPLSAADLSKALATINRIEPDVKIETTTHEGSKQVESNHDLRSHPMTSAYFVIDR